MAPLTDAAAAGRPRPVGCWVATRVLDRSSGPGRGKIIARVGRMNGGMPLQRIDMVEGRSEQQRRAIADAVHRALVDTIGVPRTIDFRS